MKKIRKAYSPEARESQLIALAYDLAEQRLLDGSATSQEVTHFLKLGSSKERMERELLEQKNELLKAKTELLENSKNTNEMYEKALEAMRSYQGGLDYNEEL